MDKWITQPLSFLHKQLWTKHDDQQAEIDELVDFVNENYKSLSLEAQREFNAMCNKHKGE